MSLTEFFGYCGAVFIGLIMGLTGSGGSILSVPILAYLFHFDEKTSTAYSLFIVGVTALFGSIREIMSGLVNKTAVLVFGVPAVVGVVFARRVIVPALPDVLFHIGNFDFTRRMFIFGLFGLLMIFAANTMLNKSKTEVEENESNNFRFHPLIVTEGLFLGVIMGLIGAGGGFLIVPALNIIGKLPIKTAMATSLVIVCMNSLIGFFLGDFFHLKVDWDFLLHFVLLSLIGIYIGGYLSKFINSEKLKTGFAYFIIVMAVFIFIMEFFVKA